MSLVDIAEDCRRMVEIRAKAKGIELTFTTADNLPQALGRRARHPPGRAQPPLATP